MHFRALSFLALLPAAYGQDLPTIPGYTPLTDPVPINPILAAHPSTATLPQQPPAPTSPPSTPADRPIPETDLDLDTDEPHLELRQNVGVGGAGNAPAAAQPTEESQVPSITVLTVYSTINGVVTPFPITYTQTFASVPDQGASPSAGTVGMGTLTGSVGVVKTDQANGGAMPRGGNMIAGGGGMYGAVCAVVGAAVGSAIVLGRW